MASTGAYMSAPPVKRLGGNLWYRSHLEPTPAPVTHLAFARAHVVQARPYGAGVPAGVASAFIA